MGKKYKIKTHKATAKRFHVTGTGKIVRTKGGKSHLRRRSAKRVKNLFNKNLEVTHGTDMKKVKKLAPYLKYRSHSSK